MAQRGCQQYDCDTRRGVAISCTEPPPIFTHTPQPYVQGKRAQSLTVFYNNFSNISIIININIVISNRFIFGKGSGMVSCLAKRMNYQLL